ncbi:L,D-transpeptidase [Lactiplantibacillus paraplantarum]|uniref:L,D-transpeptidase n=1 Tax=Lactiplantibacillus paraplantarum TaxID=60520 RepID=UPI0023AB1F80|nr:L,D-transpeptidase [Lactiplantibacillus paraplantarum]WEE35554.1 L,D-transpeptidase [Lactiplantibacillus paraplantarum]
MQRRSILILLASITLIIGTLTVGTVTIVGATHPTSQPTMTTKKTPTKVKPKARATVMRTPINWRQSSEKVAYPTVNHYPNLWIHVSLAKQRLYLMNHQHVLYTMYASSGVPTADRKTPRGTYHVQAERGKYFYSASVNEGAYYWVSWLNHGEYLFHSTPVDAQGHFIKSDAAKLGKQPSSHGCIHLSVADSKWVYDNIKYGTKVVID